MKNKLQFQDGKHPGQVASDGIQDQMSISIADQQFAAQKQTSNFACARSESPMNSYFASKNEFSSKYYLKQYYKQFGPTVSKFHQELQNKHKSTFTQHLTKQLINMEIVGQIGNNEYETINEGANNETSSQNDRGDRNRIFRATGGQSDNPRARSYKKNAYNKLVDLLLFPPEKIKITNQLPNQEESEPTSKEQKQKNKYQIETAKLKYQSEWLQHQNAKQSREGSGVGSPAYNNQRSLQQSSNILPKLMNKQNQGKADLNGGDQNCTLQREIVKDFIDNQDAYQVQNKTLLRIAIQKSVAAKDIGKTEASSRMKEFEYTQIKTTGNSFEQKAISSSSIPQPPYESTPTQMKTNINFNSKKKKSECYQNQLQNSQTKLKANGQTRKHLPSILSSTGANYVKKQRNLINARENNNNTGASESQDSQSPFKYQEYDNTQVLPNICKQLDIQELIKKNKTQLLKETSNETINQTVESENSNLQNEIIKSSIVSTKKPPHPINNLNTQTKSLYKALHQAPAYLSDQEKNIVPSRKNKQKNPYSISSAQKVQNSDISSGCFELRKLMPNENYKQSNQQQTLDPNTINSNDQNRGSPQSQFKVKNMQRNRLLSTVKDKNDSCNQENLKSLLEMLEKNKKIKEDMFETSVDDETQNASSTNLVGDKYQQKNKRESHLHSLEQSSSKKVIPPQNNATNQNQTQNQISIVQGTNIPLQIGKLINHQQDQLITKSITNQNYKKHSDRLLLGKFQNEYGQQLLFGGQSNKYKKSEYSNSETMLIIEGLGKGLTQFQPPHVELNVNIQKINIVVESKNLSAFHKKAGSQAYNNSYTTSPQFLSQIQSKVQINEFMQVQQQQKQIPDLNAFQQLMNKYPNLLKDIYLSEEAKQILQYQLAVDVLTIEIPQIMFETTLKEQLIDTFGIQIMKLVDSGEDTLQGSRKSDEINQGGQIQSNETSENTELLPLIKNNEEVSADKNQLQLSDLNPQQQPLLDRKQKQQLQARTGSLIPITNNSQKSSYHHQASLNSDNNNIINVNQLESNSKRIVSEIKQVASQKQNALQIAWSILFVNRDQIQRKDKSNEQGDITNEESKTSQDNSKANFSNINIINKYSLYYTALKHKYNMSKKQHKYCEFSFVATRDSSIINFICYLHKSGLHNNPKTLLNSISNILLVLKSDSELQLKHKNILSNSNKMPLKLDGGPSLKNQVSSPKSHTKVISITGDNDILKNQLLEQTSQFQSERSQQNPQKYTQVLAQKRAISSISNVNGFQLQCQSYLGQGIQGVNIHNNNCSSSSSLQIFKDIKQQHNQHKGGLLDDSDTDDVNQKIVNVQQEQARIKIWHIDYQHLKKSKINKAFKIYNEFIMLTFKNKQQQLNINRVFKLSKQIGLNFQGKTQITEGLFRNKETALPIKEKLYFFLLSILSRENNLTLNGNNVMSPLEGNYQQSPGYYKYYVGPGNNSLMVRNIMKQRWWWYLNNERADFDDVHFIWTQWRKQKIVTQLQSCKELLVSLEDQTEGSGGQANNLNSGSLNNSSIVGNTSAKTTQSLKNLKQNGLYTQIRKSRKSGIEEVINEQQATHTIPNFKDKQKYNEERQYNKMENNFHLSNKKALFINMRNYYEALGQNLSDALPLTFHIKGIEDPEFQRFKQHFQQVEESHQQKNIWIIKPGENTNRGQGIEVRKDLHEIQQLIEQYQLKQRTVIVQKYISNPFLINKRKFDIRCYALITSIKGQIKAYFYRDGYIRTSCKEFTLNNLNNKMIHLTNDAIQKYSDEYGKYEPGNKMSYEDFQKYITSKNPSFKVDFQRDMVPQIQKLITDTVRATFLKIDPLKRLNTFEIFGYDFMIDDQFKLYLIEANTNPCLELSSPLLAKIIPQMVENAFRIAIDPLFPPPEGFVNKKAMMMTGGEFCSQENKFELVFDERVDGAYLQEVLSEKEKIIIEIESDEEHDDESDVE